MKKKIYLFIFSVILFAAAFFVLNIEVTTRQGIDYKVSTIKIPLYLKLLDFVDRHYNYRQLLTRIVRPNDNEQEKVVKIFSWVYANIRQQPDGLPVIDDHVWHIIVRGYGVADQFSDVFATLCNYAGSNAHYLYISSKDGLSKIIFVFVNIMGKWYIFDPYNGVYFTDKAGTLADVYSIKAGDYRIKYINAPGEDNLKYENYIRNLPDRHEFTLKRENIQSPLKRILYGIKQFLAGQK